MAGDGLVPLVVVGEESRKRARAVVPLGAALPAVCATCGGPATGWRDRAFTWTPAWSYPLVVLGLHYCRTVTVSLPVCGCRVRRRWRAAGWFIIGLVPCLAAAIGSRAVADPTLGTQLLVGAGVCAAGVALLALMLTGDAIEADRIDDRAVTLDGVSPAFARAVGAAGGRRSG